MVRQVAERCDVPRVLLYKDATSEVTKQVPETTRLVAVGGTRPSLAVYIMEKKTIERVELFDNSRGSGILCGAWSAVTLPQGQVHGRA